MAFDQGISPQTTKLGGPCFVQANQLMSANIFNFPVTESDLVFYF